MEFSLLRVPVKDGIKKTLEVMQYLERLSFNRPDFVTFVYSNFNSTCSPCIPGKIWNYVKNNFQYVPDDPFDEIVTAPYLMPELRKGDCDDFALFIKACLDILGGWYTNFIILGTEKNQWTHVAVFAHRGVIGDQYRDGIYIDGANDNFNLIPKKYNWYKLI